VISWFWPSLRGGLYVTGFTMGGGLRGGHTNPYIVREKNIRGAVFKNRSGVSWLKETLFPEKKNNPNHGAIPLHVDAVPSRAKYSVGSCGSGSLHGGCECRVVRSFRLSASITSTENRGIKFDRKRGRGRLTVLVGCTRLDEEK